VEYFGIEGSVKVITTISLLDKYNYFGFKKMKLLWKTVL